MGRTDYVGNYLLWDVLRARRGPSDRRAKPDAPAGDAGGPPAAEDHQGSGHARKAVAKDPGVISVLESFADEPGEFGYARDGEKQAVREDAESLLKDLRPPLREEGVLATGEGH